MNKKQLITLNVIYAIIGGIYLILKIYPNSGMFSDYNSWNGKSFRNDFFGFSLNIPKNWHVEKMRFSPELFKESTNSFMILFIASRYDIEEAINKKLKFPVITLEAEKITNYETNLVEYIERHNADIFRRTSSVIFQPVTEREIGGKHFTSLNSEIPIIGHNAKREILLSHDKGFALRFTLYWQEDSEKQELDKILSTLKWD